MNTQKIKRTAREYFAAEENAAVIPEASKGVYAIVKYCLQEFRSKDTSKEKDKTHCHYCSGSCNNLHFRYDTRVCQHRFSY